MYGSPRSRRIGESPLQVSRWCTRRGKAHCRSLARTAHPPRAQLPELPISWGAAELCAAVAVLALLVIKILFHIGNFGWGFYVDVLLAIVLVYGATGLRHSRTVRPMATPAPQHGN
jgi:hypothetical protein